MTKKKEALKPKMSEVDKQFLEATFTFLDEVNAAADKYEAVIESFKTSQLYDLRILILQMKKAFIEAKEMLSEVRDQVE